MHCRIRSSPAKLKIGFLFLKAWPMIMVREEFNTHFNFFIKYRITAVNILSFIRS